MVLREEDQHAGHLEYTWLQTNQAAQRGDRFEQVPQSLGAKGQERGRKNAGHSSQEAWLHDQDQPRDA